MPGRSSNALGDIIRQQRELAEYSVRHFAELAGISNPYLSQIERGLRAPSEQVLDAIAQDPRLTARQRSALREVYEAFVAASPRGSSARRGERKTPRRT